MLHGQFRDPLKSKSFINQTKHLASAALYRTHARVFNGLLGAVLIVSATTGALAQGEIAMSADNKDSPLFGLVSPSLTLDLKLLVPLELTTLDLSAESTDVWDEIRKGFSIPDLNSQSVQTRERALQKNKRMVKTMLKRSEPYIYFIAQECQKRGMPSEIALLPFVESQFNPHARSRSNAEGLWQFIPSTGRQFSLNQNKCVDDLRDLVSSTRAALDYLTYLYDLHGDWHLALISYNWGEGSVLRAIRKAEEAGLQPTLANLDLPHETRQYIPKLQALKNLVQNPERFGVTLPKVPNQPYFEEIKRHADLDLREVARLAGIELEAIRKLNPGLNQPVLYAAHTNTLLVPIDYADKVQASLKNYKSPKPYRSYKVKKGDTLVGIAQKFQVKVKDIQRANSLGKKSLIRPGMTLTLPAPVESGQWSS